jgi:DNA-binding CsgD family transcriptional regulator
VRRASPESFLSSPLGSYTVGRAALVACPDAELRVCAVYGWPDARDARGLLDLLPVVDHPAFAGGVDALTDVSRMTGFDPRAFYVLTKGLVERRARYRRRIRRQAFVRQKGLVGAVVSGLYDTVGQLFPVRIFDDREAALAWLGRRDARALAGWLAAELAVASLTPRERQAVRLASQGASNKVIAYEMGISASTVSVLLHRVARKLDTRSRDEMLEVFARAE